MPGPQVYEVERPCMVRRWHSGSKRAVSMSTASINTGGSHRGDELAALGSLLVHGTSS